jgi:coenzyme F420 hydrogenase subunit beta
MMKTSPLGYLRPYVTGEIGDDLVDTVYDVCPGLRQDTLPAHLLAADTVVDPVWGPYRAMYSAHAADETTRVKAASGGVLSALSKFLLATGRVDFILHARPSTDDVTFGEAHISRTEDDVDRGTGSIYGPTAPLVDILSLLDQGKPFAYIGKPCDISALRNYATHDPRIEELIKYWLTPVCGGIVPPPQMDGFLAERGTSRGELASFRYRGDGCPGDTEFTTRDGRNGTANMYETYGGIEESAWQLPFRCKICPDGPGEGADIAAGDQWVDDVPDWEFAKIDKGTNAVIVRTKVGEELYDAAVAAGYLNTEQEITPRFYDTCQHHHVVKKMYTRARWNGLAQAGALMPRSEGLRLDAYFDANTPEVNAAQTEGTIRRVPGAREPLE